MVDSCEAIDALINENEMVLVYLGNENCGVCNALKPKIKEMLKAYPNIKSVQVDTEKSLKVAAAYNSFTIPVILLFINGKEIVREARHISIQDINNKISRYYNILFE